MCCAIYEDQERRSCPMIILRNYLKALIKYREYLSHYITYVHLLSSVLTASDGATMGKHGLR